MSLAFNDSKLRSGWNYYRKALPVNVERIECPRIQYNKSMLDVKMTACITAAHYKDGIDGIILASSDSDYWGLIDTIGATAKFFILCENGNISEKTIKALDDTRIPYCMLDDFNDDEIKNKVKEDTYRVQIKELLEKSSLNIDFFMNMLQNKTMYLPEEDKSDYRRIACELRISFDENGKITYKY